MSDSPAGVAAWILEKWRSWTDPDCAPDRDFLLTLVTLYWVTNRISTANRDYIDNYSAGTPRLDTYVSVPTAIARFHHSRVSEGVLPREWAERLYSVRRFTDMPRGGHFAAAEVPTSRRRHRRVLLAALTLITRASGRQERAVIPLPAAR